MDNGSFKSEISMINYNGNLMSSDSVSLEISNRGFQYGDGIFETIIYEENSIKFKDEHWERIVEGLQVLKMTVPFTESEFEDMLIDLLKSTNLGNRHARIKLFIWRKQGGLYTPSNFEAEYLITANETEKRPVQKFHNVAFAQTVFLEKTAFSHLKTISALPYVLAGIEKRERDLEEIILLSQNGYIAEASSSNIYFLDYKNRKIYTPSLETGCINGISRRFLMKRAESFGMDIQEVLWKAEDLNSSYSSFTINVAGVNCIRKIEEQKMADHSESLSLLEEIFKT